MCKACYDNPNNRHNAYNYDGTSHLHKHLARAHLIDVDTGQSTVEDLPANPFTAAQSTPRVAGSSAEPNQTPWQEKQLQDALVDWAIARDLSFLDVTSPATRGLITWNRAALLKALPNSVTTLSGYIKKRLEARKSELTSLLEAAQSKISISFDMWTSNNHHSFLGIVAHFVDATYNQRDVLIAFRNLFSDHTGSAQALAVLDVIREYNFEPRLHCFVSDNARNNDNKFIKAINKYSDHLILGQQHRIRCTGHIINLVVKATLFGQVSKFEETLANAAPKEQFDLWRKQGVVGKLHNFVNAVCGSHKRRERFTQLQKELTDEDPLWTFGTLHLKQDGGVRWNSVYAMLNRCRQLKPAIVKFVKACRHEDGDDDSEESDATATYCPLKDHFSDDDWDEVDVIANFLGVPFQLTKAVEGNNSNNGFGSLWQTIVDLQTLWDHYRDAQDRIEACPLAFSAYFKNAVNLGYQKLDTYWKFIVMESTPSYYCVATALHPRLRLAWFKDHWRDFDKWHRKAEADTRKVFNEYLAANKVPNEVVIAEELNRRPPASHNSSPFARTMAVDTMLLTSNANHKRQQMKNQLQCYFDDLQQDLLNTNAAYQTLLDDPWEWWKQEGRSKYPILFEMAVDFLHIPCTSCECERCFSAAKRTLPTDRNSLSPSTIEAIQLQKNWLKNKVVESPLTNLNEHVTAWDKRHAV